MRRMGLKPFLCGAVLALLSAVAPGVGAEAGAPRFDHIYLIILENHDFDEALHSGASPFFEGLARAQGLATRYYGVTHPSLPNYLAMIGGDDFGVKDDGASCFASDLAPRQSCHAIAGESLVDQLEAAGLSFALYAQGLPAAGALTQAEPPYPQALYAQKHNPFAYFERIAKNPERLRRLKPLSAFAADLAGAAPNFVMIVPDQCHDGHGLSICRDPVELTRGYDDFLARTVNAIRTSANWTRNSAIVVLFDEGEFHSVADQKPEEGDENRIATVVVTQCGAPAVSDALLNHYALLATIEDGFGLPRLRKAAGAPTMMDLFARPCESEKKL